MLISNEMALMVLTAMLTLMVFAVLATVKQGMNITVQILKLLNCCNTDIQSSYQ